MDITLDMGYLNIIFKFMHTSRLEFKSILALAILLQKFPGRVWDMLVTLDLNCYAKWF